MSFNLNKTMLAGNLTRDPEMKNLASGSAVANFGMAINRKYKDKNGEKKEDTTFVDVTAFGKTAEFVAQWFTKGKAIFVEGALRTESWEDKQSGAKRSKLVVIAENVSFVGAPEKSERSEAAPRNAVTSTQAASDGEPPF